MTIEKFALNELTPNELASVFGGAYSSSVTAVAISVSPVNLKGKGNIVVVDIVDVAANVNINIKALPNY